MSGHNRWSKIKRKKEAQGAAKGKLFSTGNPRLRAAIDAAKEANMPQALLEQLT